MSESSQIDNGRFAIRTPVIDRERSEAFKIDDLDKEWNLVTETAKQNIFQNPDTRWALIGFTTTPVSESLPASFLSSVGGVDPRVNRISSRYQRNLGAFLALPSVPDELLNPDLKTAPSIRHIHTSTHGISDEERAMVDRRYRYARDVKLLALGAEMIEIDRTSLQPQTKDDFTEYTLPSGTRIGIAIKDQQTVNDLLTPQLWEKRRQIHDRVYEIIVNGKRYILKEHKTPRHMNTIVDNQNLTSEEELKVAQKLQNVGLKADGIALNWEIPVGFVEFPDGFQFSVFEFLEGLESGEVIIGSILTQAIAANTARFTGEYEQIMRSYKRFLKHPAARMRDKEAGRKQHPLRRFLSLSSRPDELRFIDYAAVKAYRLREVAEYLLRITLIKAGYKDTDSAKIKRVNFDADLLELHKFDYEYFEPLPPEEIGPLITAATNDFLDEGERGLVGLEPDDLEDLVGKDGKPLLPTLTGMHEAAYQALVALESNSWEELGKKLRGSSI